MKRTPACTLSPFFVELSRKIQQLLLGSHFNQSVQVIIVPFDLLQLLLHHFDARDSPGLEK